MQVLFSGSRCTGWRKIKLKHFISFFTACMYVTQTRKADVTLRMYTGYTKLVERIDVINVFYVFIQVTFFTFFNVLLFFSRFLFKKTLSNAKCKYVKIQPKYS